MCHSLISTHREGTKIHIANKHYRLKTIKLLEDLNMKKALNYTFRKLGCLVSIGAKVTGFKEDCPMRQVIGTKSKELLMWIWLGEFYVNPKDTSKITFQMPKGLSKTYPMSAFELKEEASMRATWSHLSTP
ncbi:uncharacterized protein LOC144705980 [Wolffia australiana]